MPEVLQGRSVIGDPVKRFRLAVAVLMIHSTAAVAQNEVVMSFKFFAVQYGTRLVAAFDRRMSAANRTAARTIDLGSTTRTPAPSRNRSR